ncbi:MAG TPA: hypothetical protein VEL76_18510 [Gemmataceae bacterium]|nr:hypothetical protein [Gemmataceae bacterium]
MRTFLNLVFCLAFLVLVVPGCSEQPRAAPSEEQAPKDNKPPVKKDGTKKPTFG